MIMIMIIIIVNNKSYIRYLNMNINERFPFDQNFSLNFCTFLEVNGTVFSGVSRNMTTLQSIPQFAKFIPGNLTSDFSKSFKEFSFSSSFKC